MKSDDEKIDRLSLFLLRSAAFVIDQVLFIFLAALSLVPVLSLSAIVDLGYLQNFAPWLTLPASTPLLFLLAVLAGLFFFFLWYYPCRFESSQWRGTFGKHVMGLKCTFSNGERLHFWQVTWRLILQGFTVILFAQVAWIMSLPPLHTWLAVPQDCMNLIALSILFIPYMVSLFTVKGQTLIDLCTERVVKKHSNTRLNFDLLKELFGILVFGHARTSKIERYALNTLAVGWIASFCILISALFALPVCLLKVAELAKSHNAASLEQYRKTALFKRLDLVYYLIADAAQSDHKFCEDSLSKAIMLHPHCHTYWYWRAHHRVAENRYSDALADVSEAIRIYDPHSGTEWYDSIIGPVRYWDESSLYELRAELLEKLGDKKKALSDCTTAIQLSGRHEDYKTWRRLYRSVCEQEQPTAGEQQEKAIEQQRVFHQMKSAFAKSSHSSVMEQAMQLNNDGVTAIFRKDFDTAIKKLQRALAIHKKFDLAERNLAIAYNGKACGLNNPERALTYFRYALYIEPENRIAKQNVAGLMKVLGMDVHSFADHIKLADQAIAQADFRGAVVEYKSALEIKPDASIQKSLALIEREISAEKPKTNW